MHLASWETLKVVARSLAIEDLKHKGKKSQNKDLKCKEKWSK